MLTEEKRHENVFRLKGTMNIQVYLAVNEKTTVKELADSMSQDIQMQFLRRLALIKEAVEDNSKS